MRPKLEQSYWLIVADLIAAARPGLAVECGILSVPMMTWMLGVSADLPHMPITILAAATCFFVLFNESRLQLLDLCALCAADRVSIGQYAMDGESVHGVSVLTTGRVCEWTRNPQSSGHSAAAGILQGATRLSAGMPVAGGALCVWVPLARTLLTSEPDTLYSMIET